MTLARRRFSQTATAAAKQPTVLCILDGWGYTEEHPEHNAVHLANTPNFDDLMNNFPRALLEASEEAVGLPSGQFGNSEVGHMNIGAGRVIYQDILRIRNGFDDGSIRESEALQQHISKLRASGGTCHLMGLTSDGGVHGMQEYMALLANEVHAAGVPVVVHVFTDGRDTPPQDAVHSLPRFLDALDDGVTIGTVTGRFYAMDRDTRWERVGQAYDALVHARAPQAQVGGRVHAEQEAERKACSKVVVRDVVCLHHTTHAANKCNVLNTHMCMRCVCARVCLPAGGSARGSDERVRRGTDGRVC